jgi:diguanylate cyclase (GGDEF)-like protein/PAS domain S-box-containing protein
LYKLASFSELSPYPIIEINLQGKITYYNQAASLIFKDLPEKQLNHPILADILPTTDKEHGSLLVREISIKEQTFAQYIHYLPQLKLIRNYIFDLTERKIIEQELQNSEAKYKAVVKQINEGIFLVDANSKQIIETNEAASQLLGYSPQELTTFKVDDFLVNKHQEFSQYLRNVLNNNNYNITKELEYKHKQGHVIDVEISATVINYAQRQIICFVFRNITKRKHLEDKLKYTAYHDNLTGLYNRSFFNEYFKKALINAKRQNHLIAIMFIDLDHFKEINDNYGHKFGDELLQQFAQRLQTCLRSQDITARWGGDEFTILLPNIHTEKEVIKIAERIINSLKNPFQIGANPISLRSSIGISIYPDHAQDPETLLIKADLALYCTKEKGRNNYLLYHTDINN